MSEAPSNARGRVKAMAHESLGRNDPIAWFDRVYREARGQPGAVPWADLEPNPALLSWVKLSPGGEAARSSWDGCGERALVVGAGLGDDAEYLSARGCDVVAFDVSDTAVAWCKERFPASRVRYEVADLLAPPASYAGAFDFVLEAYTIQSLPPGSAERARAIDVLPTFLAPGGLLLVIARFADRLPARDEGPPWPLVAEELDALGRKLPRGSLGRDEIEDDGVRRVRASYRRPR